MCERASERLIWFVDELLILWMTKIHFFHPFGRVTVLCERAFRVSVCVCEGDARKAAMAGGTMGMKGAWAWYQSRLHQQPVRTQMVTSGILWAAGDAMAQSISRSMERRSAARENSNTTTVVDRKPLERAPEKTDWRRVATASSFGIGFVGPIGHLWYEALESVCINQLKLRPNSLHFITTKVMADTFIFGPVHLLAFFTYMGLASGKPWVEVKGDVKRDFLPSYMTEGLGWMVVQVVNFRFLPVRHQLLYVNCFCLLDSAFLSWVKHQDDAPWKKYLTSLVSSSFHETKS